MAAAAAAVAAGGGACVVGAAGTAGPFSGAVGANHDGAGDPAVLSDTLSGNADCPLCAPEDTAFNLTSRHHEDIDMKRQRRRGFGPGVAGRTNCRCTGTPALLPAGWQKLEVRKERHCLSHEGSGKHKAKAVSYLGCTAPSSRCTRTPSTHASAC